MKKIAIVVISLLSSTSLYAQSQNTLYDEMHLSLSTQEKVQGLCPDPASLANVIVSYEENGEEKNIGFYYNASNQFNDRELDPDQLYYEGFRKGRILGEYYGNNCSETDSLSSLSSYRIYAIDKETTGQIACQFDKDKRIKKYYTDDSYQNQEYIRYQLSDSNVAGLTSSDPNQITIENGFKYFSGRMISKASDNQLNFEICRTRI